MALKRSVTETMVRWHADPSRKALLVTGARQVGKTFAIREFMQAHYETALEINFIETPQAKAIFEGSLDAGTLIANLTAFSGRPMTPGKSVVFIDEIQECPRARSAIKFLVDDGRFDYIESGSLLGVLYRGVPSLPASCQRSEYEVLRPPAALRSSTPLAMRSLMSRSAVSGDTLHSFAHFLAVSLPSKSPASRESTLRCLSLRGTESSEAQKALRAKTEPISSELASIAAFKADRNHTSHRVTSWVPF